MTETPPRYDALLSSEARAPHRGGPALAEMAILFTDVRRSTQLISSLPLPAWFAAMNRCLTDQAELVHDHGGMVVKFTGDGLLAGFRGRGRSYLAMRCAAALQQLDRTAPYRETLRAGFGTAEGLVMCGPIGAPGRQQFDVIGATVHLAARLCSIAAAGEIIATPRMAKFTGFAEAMPHAIRTVPLRGFDAPIDCISFGAIDP